MFKRKYIYVPKAAKLRHYEIDLIEHGRCLIDVKSVILPTGKKVVYGLIERLREDFVLLNSGKYRRMTDRSVTVYGYKTIMSNKKVLAIPEKERKSVESELLKILNRQDEKVNGIEFAQFSSL